MQYITSAPQYFILVLEVCLKFCLLKQLIVIPTKIYTIKLKFLNILYYQGYCFYILSNVKFKIVSGKKNADAIIAL